MKQWMIYGATGYTGGLIAREAQRRGLKPILAGRSREACSKLAEELGLESRIFPCDNAAEIEANLRDVDLVLHCAGPFSSTSEPMFEACLATQTHYLDITGEIPVFENIHLQAKRVKDAGIVAIPGVGFDIVPTDCVGALLKAALPDADHLALGFKTCGTLSPGTAKTAVEGLGKDGAVRMDGRIRNVPSAFKVRRIRFEKSERLATTIPWGDVSTAYYSTGIPNIEVYLNSSPAAVKVMRLSRWLKPILSMESTQSALKKLAGRLVTGPDTEARGSRKTIVWGEAINQKGQKVEMRLRVPEPYALTVDTALKSAEKVLAGTVAPGAWTPSKAFGKDFIFEFSGVEKL